ncbi:hypothetical protein EJB05_29272, partial [Eragrostis curvula]
MPTVSSSLRAAASSFRESLSRSLSLSGDQRCKEKDDELELKWAAVERLPTSDRLHTALLHARLRLNDNNNGDAAPPPSSEVVDVRRLGAAERRMVVDALVANNHRDNLRLLRKQRQRMDRVGVRQPTVEVRWRDVCVDAECQVVQGKPLPTIWNAAVSSLSGVSRMLGFNREQARVPILNNVSGIVRPSRLTLLLGPPGCGKSTLLKALAGKLDANNLKVTGEIEYNGVNLDEFVPEKTAAYIDQYDLHVPEMTVRETLDFSARFQGVGSRAEIMKEVIRREKEAGITPNPDLDTYMKAISIEGLERSIQTDYILKIMGLDICADIMVGDAMRRGISGGEKKRLTTASYCQTMVAGPVGGPIAFLVILLFGGFIIPRPSLPNWLKWGFWLSPLSYAEIGLTGNELLAPRWLKSTTLGVSLGRRTLMDRGLDFSSYFYWISVGALIGFILLFNIGFAIGLTIKKRTSRAIISRDKMTSFHGRDQPILMGIEYKPPQTEAPLPLNRTGRMVLPFTPLTISFQDVSYYVDTPALMLMKRGGELIYAGSLGHHSCKVIQYFQQGNIKHINDQQSLFTILGCMYGTTLFAGINNCQSVMPFISIERSVVYRERFAGMYSPWAYSFAQVSMEIPYVFLQVAVFMFIAYPMIGYAWTAAKFFWFVYTMSCTLLYYIYLGMMLVSLTPNVQLASILASVFYMIQNLMSGFIVPAPQIPKWWIWMYYTSPMSWTLNVFFTTQFGYEDNKKIEVFGETRPVATFVRDYFDFRRELLPLAAVVLLAYPIIFATLFGYNISKLNFQRR